MTKRLCTFLIITLCCVFCLTFPGRISAANTPATPSASKTDYLVGTVTQITSEGRTSQDDVTYYTQQLKVKRQDNGEVLDVQAGSEYQPLNEHQRLKTGTQVILAHQEITPGQWQYVLADVYRLPTLAGLAFGFFVLVIIIARKHGALAIVGMVLSLFILTYQTVPQIWNGQNPLLVSLLGCSIIAVFTVYLCHGFNRESHVALFSMFLTLAAVSILSYVVVQVGHLAGLGSEEAYYLQFGQTSKLNLQGLLLGGIMLGTLGVLDDICLAQVSIVGQLREAKPDIEFHELYTRSLAVGKDHVASLVNTLILAYAGSSLPLFLLFTMSQVQPTWVTLNSELIAEEIVRTLTGSIGLVLAVPLTTLAATFFALRISAATSKKSHLHHH